MSAEDEKEHESVEDRTDRLPSVDRAKRDVKIVEMRAKGHSWRSIAEVAGVGERRCREIWEEYRNRRPSFRGRDPINVVEDMLDRYEHTIEELAYIAATASQDSNRIGAIKAKMDAMKNSIELMQATGLLPRDLGKLRVEMDVRVLAHNVLRIFEEHGVPVETQEAIIEAIEGQAAKQG